jgi:hypothetical protein
VVAIVGAPAAMSHCPVAGVVVVDADEHPTQHVAVLHRALSLYTGLGVPDTEHIHAHLGALDRAADDNDRRG